MTLRINSKSILIACLACLMLLTVAAMAQAQPAPWSDKDLPSWNNPMRQMLLEYVFAVSTPGHKDFIPAEDRLASFDMDGTLISERPILFVMEIALARMAQACGRLSRISGRNQVLCNAAARKDIRFLYRHIGETLERPFLGMTHAEFRALALKVFETMVNPDSGRPLYKNVFRPQIELIDLLHRRGFKVYLNSGSDVFALMAISQKYLHVPPERCIGTVFQVQLKMDQGRLRFYRSGIGPRGVNLRQVKAANFVNRTGRAPVLAFGNSSGDEWMLRFAAASPRRSLSLLLNHDDPREFVYGKRGILDMARKEGWHIVSMKQAFKEIY